MEELVVNGQAIEAGQHEVLKIHIGKLPSGTRIYIYAHIFRSMEEGPVVLVSGGLHGDEINGIQIVRQALSSGLFAGIRAGTVIAIPLVNIYGFLNFSREVPDGKDVNRSFPGNMKGSLASRISRTLTKKVLPVVDIGIDFHTGGASRFNYPQIRYTRKDERAGELARAFAPPVILGKSTLPKSLRKTAYARGIPFLVYEGGESLRLDGIAIDKGLRGLERMLFHLGMTGRMTDPNHRVLQSQKTGWVRAAHAGLFTWSKPSGHFIRKGEPLGLIHDPYGNIEVKVVANRDGFIIGHNNASVVNQGDALFHIAYQMEEIT